MYRILHTEPAPLESLVPGIDPEIPKIIERAMAKEPAQRYQNPDAPARGFRCGSELGSTGLESKPTVAWMTTLRPAVDPPDRRGRYPRLRR